MSVPLPWYPRLAHGTPAERADWRLISRGESVHWPDLDEDISVAGLLAGRPSGETQSSLHRWSSPAERLANKPLALHDLMGCQTMPHIQSKPAAVSTFLMFQEGNAQDAMSLYASVFPAFRIERIER